ncbi:hypothetical protein RLEG12_09460 (plasmid) [Rhizobium leguminosarum bv. trifolii CB782]|nr:hypothetical protein RLEG12_09460 [Rhizobium leguminosarum bv. trifolii CB782]
MIEKQPPTIVALAFSHRSPPIALRHQIDRLDCEELSQLRKVVKRESPPITPFMFREALTGSAATCKILHQAQVIDRVGLSSVLRKKEPMDRFTQRKSVRMCRSRQRRITFRLAAKPRHRLPVDEV